jgi:hypothetical protein
MKKELLSSKVIGTRRYQREGAGPKTSLCQNWTDLAVCRRCSPSGDRVRLHSHPVTRRSGEISGRIQRVSAGGRLLRPWRIFQVGTRHDRGRMLDARPEVFLQSVGIRRATHGTGAAPDRTPVCRGGARQGAVAVGGAKVGVRQRVSARLLGKLHLYQLELQPEVLPKSPSGAAVRYITRCPRLSPSEAVAVASAVGLRP